MGIGAKWVPYWRNILPPWSCQRGVLPQCKDGGDGMGDQPKRIPSLAFLVFESRWIVVSNESDRYARGVKDWIWTQKEPDVYSLALMLENMDPRLLAETLSGSGNKPNQSDTQKRDRWTTVGCIDWWCSEH